MTHLDTCIRSIYALGFEAWGPFALRRLAGGKVDVLVAGPPCQGFSIGGPRAQSHPSRDLVYEVVRVIAELKPRAFLVENVPGLLRYQGGLVVDSFFPKLARVDLKGERYTVVLDTIDAADLGVPQHRKRVFICGSIGGRSSSRRPPGGARP